MAKVQGKKTLGREIDEEEHPKIYGGLREGVRTETCVHGLMDPARSGKCDAGWGTWTYEKEVISIPVVGGRGK